MNKKNGFTLIEMMIVVVVISILSGVVVSVLNQGKQRDRAKDSVSLANLEKVVSAIESYFYSEGTYPTIESTDNGNPLNNSSNIVLDQYVQIWPEGFVYIYDNSSNQFAVYVKRISNDNYYKFSSTSGEIQECYGSTLEIQERVSACDVVTN
ncbi:type II secretion system protein [candidate division WWE3 bacterium]|uniref:Type II secretion system protein n=1 Tax=candidate division WWE3 bacterium TaxID=2053526 RepID=A0A7X9HSQ7_UNCKA|nr:type II secretion system protein [candidate division WWE3 bacterium]